LRARVEIINLGKLPVEIGFQRRALRRPLLPQGLGGGAIERGAGSGDRAANRRHAML